LSKSMTPDPAGLLAALQLRRQRFPAGGFAFSWGLEGLVADGLIDNEADVAEIIEEQLVHRWNCMDRILLLRAYEAPIWRASPPSITSPRRRHCRADAHRIAPRRPRPSSVSLRGSAMRERRPIAPQPTPTIVSVTSLSRRAWSSRMRAFRSPPRAPQRLGPGHRSRQRRDPARASRPSQVAGDLDQPAPGPRAAACVEGPASSTIASFTPFSTLRSPATPAAICGCLPPDLDEASRRMNLSPTEMDRLTIFTAAELARRHKSLGIKLSHPEAVALITTR